MLDIYELESAQGVITSMGGQQPQNIANTLYGAGVNILGTHPHMVDMAENRFKFSQLLDSIHVDQPAWAELASTAEAEAFSDKGITHYIHNEGHFFFFVCVY